MFVHLKTLTGKTYTVLVEKTNSVSDIKTQLAERMKIPIENIHIKYGYKLLSNGASTLEELTIKDGSVCIVVFTV